MASRQARVRAIGLSTALGDGVEANRDGLRRGLPSVGQVELATAGEVASVPYLSVGTPDVAAADFYRPLEVAVRGALAEAQLADAEVRTMPLYIGSTSYSVRLAELRFQQELAQAAADPVPLPMVGFDQAAAHLREAFGLNGAEYLINTACAASANALLAAATAIRAGSADHALVVGLELFNLTTLSGFYGMQLLTRDVMRPFDRRRDGLVLGEGCGAVILSAAGPDEGGLFVTAGASACDTHSITASNPDGTAIADVMHAAMNRAALQPGQIRAVKAHGTASPLNDDGEAAGMHRVFASVPPVFALKPYVGHTLGGCGAIEVALMIAAFRGGFIPRTPGFELRDEQLNIDPLTESMEAVSGHYMLNFFGFGGNNSTLIMSAR
jgi:3-oxoacyl-[acyl-carrier-protein] synthase-1